MHVDARTQRALREAGFETDEGAVYSDMELAHNSGETQEHPAADVDRFTHGADLRGYLSLGPTVHDRVRFARERERL